MKFIKLDLLTLLISLFLFASCENTSTIGLEVDPSIAIKGSLVDTLTIQSRTLEDDITQAAALVRHPLGFLKDPTFGTTESSLAMSVNLPNDAYAFGTNAVLDSAVLVLNYGGQFYGDSTSTYSIDVHQLTNDISTQSSFLQNRQYTFNSTLLGNKTGKVYPKTTFKITDIVTGAADTLKRVTPQVRIKLSNAFIKSNILDLTAASLKYNSYFVSAFKGLHVQINKANSTGVGGLMFFDFAGTNSNLVLYFKRQNATNATAIDTVAASFPISLASNPIAASIKHDYTGTDIKTQLDDTDPKHQYAVTYLQPLSGLKNKISFPYLTKFKTEIGKIVVNKAELVVEVSSGSDPIPFDAAPRLSLYRYDIASQRTYLPDNNSGTSTTVGDSRAVSETVFGGYYDSLKKRYVFVVTAYIQDLLDGKSKDYGTFLAPTPSTEYSNFPSLSTGARVVVGSFKKTPSAGDNVMKLNIYYTKIN